MSDKRTTYYSTCVLGGLPAELVLHATLKSAHHASQAVSGRISAAGTIGMRLEIQGTVTSATAHYSFSGENTFADFSHHESGERFLVQFQTDDARGGIWMTVNPFGGGGKTEYFCKTVRVVEHL